MLAFNNDSKVKEDYLKKIDDCYEFYKRHEPYKYVRLMENSRDPLHPNLVGLPDWLGDVIDSIMGNTPKHMHHWLPYNLIKFIPIGADLDVTYNRFASWLLTSDGPNPTEANSREEVQTLSGFSLQGDSYDILHYAAWYVYRAEKKYTTDHDMLFEFFEDCIVMKKLVRNPAWARILHKLLELLKEAPVPE